MFATLLDSRGYAPSFEARVALLQRLGGPFLTHDRDEGRLARAAGMQIGLLVNARGGDGAEGSEGSGAVGERDISVVRDLAPEIVAIRCSALGDARFHDEAPRGAERRHTLLARLSKSLEELRGAHRMIVAIDGTIAPLSAGEWGSLEAESLAIDPIGDPDSWRAAATWPGARGLLLGLVPPPGGAAPQGPEVLLWAVSYAASLGGRGGDRVGVAGLPIRAGGDLDASVVDSADVSVRVDALSEIVGLVAADGATRRARLDPRAVSPAARLLDRRRSR